MRKKLAVIFGLAGLVMLAGVVKKELAVTVGLILLAWITGFSVLAAGVVVK